MNIILCQHRLIDLRPDWKVVTNYSGDCNILIVLVYEKTDIVRIDNINYKHLFVIIANTSDNRNNSTNIIGLSKLVLRCPDEDIFFENHDQTLLQIMEIIRRRTTCDYGFWVASVLLLIAFSFMGIYVLATLYKVISEN